MIEPSEGEQPHFSRKDIGRKLLNRLKNLLYRKQKPQEGIIRQMESPTYIPEPLSGDETAAIIADLYDLAEPRLGAAFVEANNVLTIAGVRGQTEFFIHDPREEDRETIMELDEALKSRGMSMRTVGDVIKRPNERDTLMVNLMNLKGFERVSKLTHIPGILPFEASTGWEGFREWSSRCFSKLEELSATGKLPFPESEVDDVVAGVHKGYPDQAIYDAVEWWGENNRTSPIRKSDISHATLYGGAEPTFLYRPDHAEDSGIKQTVSDWGKILENFYASPWHQNIKNNPQFIEARKLR
jgi:hypothetical protein